MNTNTYSSLFTSVDLDMKIFCAYIWVRQKYFPFNVPLKKLVSVTYHLIYSWESLHSKRKGIMWTLAWTATNNIIHVVFVKPLCGSLRLVSLWSEDRADIFSHHYSAKQWQEPQKGRVNTATIRTHCETVLMSTRAWNMEAVFSNVGPWHNYDKREKWNRAACENWPQFAVTQ